MTNEDEARRRIFEISYLFKETINRVWCIMRNLSYICTIDPTLLSQLSLKNGKDTWTKGNVIKANWVGVCPLEAVVTDVSNNGEVRKIEWEYELAIQVKFRKTLSFYSITDDDSTLVILKIEVLSIDQSDYIPIISEVDYFSYKDLYVSLLKKYDRFMQKTSYELFSYESCIINTDIQTLWDFVTNLNLFAKVSHLFADNFEYRGDMYKIGTFIKGKLDDDKTLFLRVTNVDNKSSFRWKYSLSTFGTNPGALNQNVDMIFIRVGKQATQFSLYNTFKENLRKETIAMFGKEKKEAIVKLKNHFDDAVISSIKSC